MIQYISAAGDRRDEAIRELGRLITLARTRHRGGPYPSILTGGSSTDFWVPTVLGTRMPEAGYFLTDFFGAELARARGRHDTNEESVRKGGLTAAMQSGIVAPDQVFFPDYTVDPHWSGVVKAYARRFCGFRPDGVAGEVFLSGGGPEYAPGIYDPGHVAGLSHGQPGLLELTAPYVPNYEMPKPPEVRGSMSFEMIRKARFVVLFILGAKKAGTLENVKARKPLVECPACIIHEVAAGEPDQHERAVVVTDIE